MTKSFTTLQNAWLDSARAGDHEFLARVFSDDFECGVIRNMRRTGRSFFLQELAAAYDEKQKR